MAPRTQQAQVVDVGGSAVAPPVDVVHLAARRPRSAAHAAHVARDHRGALPWGGVAAQPPGVQHLVVALDDHGHVGVAADLPRGSSRHGAGAVQSGGLGVGAVVQRVGVGDQQHVRLDAADLRARALVEVEPEDLLDRVVAALAQVTRILSRALACRGVQRGLDQRAARSGERPLQRGDAVAVGLVGQPHRALGVGTQLAVSHRVGLVGPGGPVQLLAQLAAVHAGARGRGGLVDDAGQVGAAAHALHPPGVGQRPRGLLGL